MCGFLHCLLHVERTRPLEVHLTWPYEVRGHLVTLLAGISASSLVAAVSPEGPAKHSGVCCWFIHVCIS